MKRVLIISYYWPPAGGGGVQRWLKMSKYLHEGGWQPIIYTPSNAEVAGMDDSLINEIHSSVEVIKSPIWEPYDIYKKVLGIKKEEKIYSGFIQKDSKRPLWLKALTQWIRGNFFIPDARRFWIRPGIHFLNEYLQNHKIDAIISTGPPHSTHMIAMSIAESNNIPWVADFRDPWTKIDFYKHLRLTWVADKIHKRLELKVLKQATKVVTISPTLVNDLKEICKRDDIVLITNGYDPADFESSVSVREDKFVISHIGSMNADRNPVALWQAISNIISKSDADFKGKLEILLIGPVDDAIFSSIKEYELLDNLVHKPFLSHDLAIEEMKKSSLLLLSINNTDNQGGILPGKMFEYIGSGRDILCIGPSTGDAVEILKTCQPEAIAHFDDENRIKDIILNSYNRFLINVSSTRQNKGVQYSRQELAKKYCELLDSLT